MTCKVQLVPVVGSISPKFLNKRSLSRLASFCVGLVLLNAWLLPSSSAQTAVAVVGFESTVLTSSALGSSTIAVDASGNIFMVDTLKGQVLKETLNSGEYTEQVIASGLTYPNGIAVGAGGTVYIGDTYNSRVLIETPSSSGYTESFVTTNTLILAYTVAVDASGDIYIGGGEANSFEGILRETPTSGGYSESIVVNAAPGGLGAGFTMSVDTAGNVYVTDTGNGQVLEESPSQSGYVQTVIASNLLAPIGNAVDGQGNVYFETPVEEQILKETPSAAGFTESSVPHSATIGSTALAVTAKGDLYFAGILSIVKESAAGSFGTVDIGASSSTISALFSTGASLTGLTPGVKSIGTSEQDFVNPGSGSCPSDPIIVTSYPVAELCTVDVVFSPQSSGLKNGLVELTDSSGNVVASGQLTGTGSGGTQQIAMSSTATGLTIASGTPSTSATIQLVPGGGFTGSVSLTCSVKYQGQGAVTDPPTCSISPNQSQISGSSPVSATLMVARTVATSSIRTETKGRYAALSFVALGCIVLPLRRRRLPGGVLLSMVCAFVLFGWTVGCSGNAAAPSSNTGGSSTGGSGSTSPGTTTGNYQVTLTAAGGSLTSSMTLPLTIQ